MILLVKNFIILVDIKIRKFSIIIDMDSEFKKINIILNHFEKITKDSQYIFRYMHRLL